MKTIYFDLDGPILDVAPKFYQIYSEIMQRHGHACLDATTYWKLKREKTPIPDIIARTAPGNFAQTYIAERLDVIENSDYLAYDRLQDGIVELLTDLRDRCKLILVTLRNNAATLNWELEHFDLKNYFDAILSLDNNHGDFRIKVQLIREFSSAEVDAVAIVGDTESDIKAGQELELSTIATTAGIRSREYLQRLGPDYIVDTSSEMRSAIETELAK